MSLLFKKEYSAEELSDVGRDVEEAFDGVYNPVIFSLPTDLEGWVIGRFVVTIEWEPE
jgi:hypothetical protein